MQIVTDEMLLPVAAAAANGFRLKMIIAAMVGLAIFAFGIYLLIPWFKKLTTTEKQLGFPQCNNDFDCPPNTICNLTGMCVPDIIVPQIKDENPMGRGRDGDGVDVQRVKEVRM